MCALSDFQSIFQHLKGRRILDLFRPITGAFHRMEIINQWCRHRRWGGGNGAGGGGGFCRMHTAGSLAWSFWGIGTQCVNVVVVQIVLPLIHSTTFLSKGVKKMLHTIWYSCPCYESLEAMPNLFGNILLLNLSRRQHSRNTHGSGLIKQFDHILVHLKNKNTGTKHVIHF